MLLLQLFMECGELMELYLLLLNVVLTVDYVLLRSISWVSILNSALRSLLTLIRMQVI